MPFYYFSFKGQFTTQTPSRELTQTWCELSPWGDWIRYSPYWCLMLFYPMLAGTHFTYPQRDGGLSQPQARLSQEWVLNLGSVAWHSTALPTELSQLNRVIPVSHPWIPPRYRLVIIDKASGEGETPNSGLMTPNNSYPQRIQI